MVTKPYFVILNEVKNLLRMQEIKLLFSNKLRNSSGFTLRMTVLKPSLSHYHSGNETRRVDALHRFVPKNYVEINSKDAKKLKIKEGELVSVSTRRGSIKINARVSDCPKREVIFISSHFKEAAANLLTNPALDPVCKIPEFKVCTAKIKKIKKL